MGFFFYSGTLLAQSPLDEEIKNTVIENMDKITESQLDQIISSLERETLELVTLNELLKNFDEQQNSAWVELEKKQKAKANKMDDEALQKALLDSIET